MNRDADTQRKEVWIAAWCATAGASNCTGKHVPAAWADRCLEEFDERFPITENSNAPADR